MGNRMIRLTILSYLKMYYLHPFKFRRIIKAREGHCLGCGECCKNLMDSGIDCPLLVDEHCVIYKWRRFIPVARQICYFAPLDLLLCCGYHWKKDE